MKYELITDGDKWAIKKIKGSWHEEEYFAIIGDTIFWWNKHSKYFKDCWMEKEKAEMWFRRFTA